MGKQIKKYHFESSHVPYSVCDLEVTIYEDKYCYIVDGSETEVNFKSPSLRRENEEMIMVFDFTTNEAFVELKENQSRLCFEVIKSDLKFEDNVLHLDFTYVIDEEEMFTSISIV